MKRARTPEAKEKRRERLLEVALKLFEQDEDSLSMDRLAKASNLAKGTMYLYFKTKEEVLLALYEQEFAGWLDQMKSLIATRGVPQGPEALSQLILESTESQETLFHLSARLQSIIEQNISVTRALEFKRWLLGELRQAGLMIESALTLKPGKDEGLRLMLRLHAYISGLWQLAHPSSVVQEALEKKELAALRIDFKTEFRTGLRALCESAAG